MYESFFQFRQRPFASTPQADRYFPSETIEAARNTLARGIERAEGPGVVMGPAGTGKSLLCEILARQFRGRFQVALLAGAGLRTRRALLQNILFTLNLPYRDMEEGELRLSLIDHLEPSPQTPHGLLLLIDEAHVLPPRLLEEIRMITNIVREGRPRVRLVLAGGSALEEKFANPKLESFNQRIAARCYLQTLQKDETISYVQFQTRDVGGRAQPVFTAGALSAIYHATNGIPRLINQVCDHALLMASLGGILLLDAEGIEEAWADLQQLPAPWNESPRGAPLEGSDVIEFGTLDDDLADSPAEAAAHLSDSWSDHSTDDVDFHEAVVPIQPGRPWLSATASPASAPSRAAQPQPAEIPAAADPFGKDFDEEELVIDQYATLDAQTAARLPRVKSEEGESLAALLFGTADRNASLPARSTSASPRSEPPAQTRPMAPKRAIADAPDQGSRALTWTAVKGGAEPQELVPHDWIGKGAEPSRPAATLKQLDQMPFHPSEDPVMPEVETHSISPSRAASTPAGPPAPQVATPTEDVSVIAADERDSTAAPYVAGRTDNQRRRQEYRRLFATLRRSNPDRSKAQ